MHFKNTQFGFEWGSMNVMRVASHEKSGWVILMIKTPINKIEIYATKTGKIRIFSNQGEWFPKEE